MPCPLIASTIVAPFMKFYQETLGYEILAPLVEFGSFDVSTETIHSAFLKWFPHALMFPDILNAARVTVCIFIQVSHQNWKYSLFLRLILTC